MAYFPPPGLLPGFPDSSPQPLGSGVSDSSWFAGNNSSNALFGYFKFYAGTVLLGDDGASPKLHNGVGILIDDSTGIHIYSGVGSAVALTDDVTGSGNSITLTGNAGVGGIDIVPKAFSPVHVGTYDGADDQQGLVFSNEHLWIYDLSDPRLTSAAFETRQLFANDGTVVAIDWSSTSSISFLDGAASIDSSGVISGNGSALSGITASQIGLGSVTNDAQTKAAIVPNTAPAAGKILAGNAGGTAYAPVTVSGSGATISLASTGVITISAIANASLSNSSITIGGTSTALGGSVLGNVTDDAQTKAAVVPNTAPSAGQIFVGNAGGTAYAKQTLSGSGATATLSSSGVLTLSAIAISSLASSTSTAIGVGSIELGHASDTTIARSGSGAITVEGVAVLLSGGALGTPSSATLTNATGLPISGLTASTSTALGVGSIELGHASDTTIARSGAGAITVEGTPVLVSSATGVQTFLTTPSSANLLAAMTDETGTGACVFGTAPTLTNPIVGTQAAGDNSTKAASTAYVDGSSTNHGGWTSKWVSGSDFTTTNLTATTITGLTTDTLLNSTLYEFECVFKMASTSSAGDKVAVTGGGTGTAATVAFSGTSWAGSLSAIGVSAIDTLSQAIILANGDGTATFRGFVTTRGTGTATFSIQLAKVTSGTATVYIGSVLRYRLAGV